MQVEPRSPVLDDWLGRVRSSLPVTRGRDIVRELESSIRDRVDDLAAVEGRAPDDDHVRRALSEMGEPERVAGEYVGERPFFLSDASRPFLFYAAVLFAAHLALVGVATTTGRALQFGPLAVTAPSAPGFFGIAAAVLHALLLDVGLMVFVFAGAGALRRRVKPRSLAVDASPRGAAGRAALTLLVAVLLNLFRDRLFVVVNGSVAYPIFTEWFVVALPVVNAVLVLSVLSDGFYLLHGETRATLVADAVHGVAGLAAMLYLLRGDSVLALPPIEAFGAFLLPVNAFLAQLSMVVIGFMALVFAVKTVRRLVRVAQI